MAQDDEAPSRDPITDWPISPDPLRSFEPMQIIVRHIFSSDDNPKPHYRQIDMPKRYYGRDHLRRLVRTVATSNDWHGTNDREEEIPLDIPVYQSSYIVLKMDEQFGGFAPPGVTLLNENEAYGELRYVDEAGKILPTWPTSGTCPVILFAARLRTGVPNRPYKQHLNYYPVKSARGFVPIDPDIRYPGNGGKIDEP